MKIVYANEQVKESLVTLQKDKPHLYEMCFAQFNRMKQLDYDEMMAWIKEEHSRKNDRKVIKEIEPPFYELRLPPKHKREVLRIEFK